jgi:hypothetical protein
VKLLNTSLNIPVNWGPNPRPMIFIIKIRWLLSF